MLKIEFEYKEDEEFGEMGWCPKTYPMFNSSTSGRLIAHDVLEHFQQDPPDLYGEIKALGACINVRYLGGYQHITGGWQTSENILSSDLAKHIQDINYGMYLAKPPKTHKLQNEEAEYIIDNALRIALRDYKEYYCDDDSNKLDSYDLSLIIGKMRGWLRIGFRQSVKRFYNADNNDLAYFFHNLEKEIDKKFGDWGDELIVKVNPRSLNFDVEVKSPIYED